MSTRTSTLLRIGADSGVGEPLQSPRFAVTSPELPCGAAWLANALLELGVPLWNLWGFDTRREWFADSCGGYQYVASDLPWLQCLPSLVAGREFHFDERFLVTFSHGWPEDVSAESAVVLFVRDPRDALYSEWRRQARNGGPTAGLGFAEFLKHPYYHHPFSFRDYLFRYLHAWKQALDGQRHLVVRFEDAKLDPAGTLGKVAQFMSKPADEAALGLAASRSDFKNLKSIEDRLESEGRLSRQFNRSGTPYEHRTSFTNDMRQAMGNGFDELNEWLKYDV